MDDDNYCLYCKHWDIENEYMGEYGMTAKCLLHPDWRGRCFDDSPCDGFDQKPTEPEGERE